MSKAVPGELVQFWDHVQVEAAMRGKLEWAQNKLDNFLKDDPSTSGVEKFLTSLEEEVRNSDMERIFEALIRNGMRGNTPLVRLPFPNDNEHTTNGGQTKK